MCPKSCSVRNRLKQHNLSRSRDTRRRKKSPQPWTLTTHWSQSGDAEKHILPPKSAGIYGPTEKMVKNFLLKAYIYVAFVCDRVKK